MHERGKPAPPPSLLIGLPALAAAELSKLAFPDRLGNFETAAAESRLRDDAGERMLIGARQFDRVRLRSQSKRGSGPAWALDVRTIINPNGRPGEPLMVQDAREHVVSGAAGLRALAVLLARPNAGGAGRRQVQAAVKRIDRARTAERFLATAEDETRRMGMGYRDIWHMPLEIRLAMEMAAHEDAERRALEAELVDLERHWREAEELAAIADALPLASGFDTRLDGLRGQPAHAPPPPVLGAGRRDGGAGQG